MSVQFIKYNLLFILILGVSIPNSSLAQGKYEKKITEFENNINKYRESGNKSMELDQLNKAAFYSWDHLDYNRSVKYFTRAVEISIENDNKNGAKLISYYLGIIYIEMEEYQQAIKSFQKGIEISRELKSKNSIVSGLINLTQAYQGFGDHAKANQSAFEALELAKELNDLKLIRSCYGLISENYKALNDSKKSIEYFNLFASIDQHIKKQEMAQIKKESENEVNKAKEEKRETEKELIKKTDELRVTEDSLTVVERISREQQIQLELKESQIREKEAQLKFEKLLRNIFIFGFIILLIFASLLFILYRKIKHQKFKIEEQRDKLDRQNKQINASINYAQNIQKAILSTEESLSDVFEMFILFRPKDVVSGDFYWFNQKNNKFIFSVIDCTGHGVPGAFMSMIGNMLLNEIILEHGNTDPASILHEMDERIIQALKQEQTENKDGMDLGIVVMEKNTDGSFDAIYSGAKRPLYHFNQLNNAYNEFKGDRFSIGGNINQKDKNFTNQKLIIKPSETIYLFSDGIIDQNNIERKRFGSKKFLNLLSQNIKLPLKEQKVILENELDNFQHNTNQRDDITVMGIKVK